MSAKERRKGARGELEVCKLLTEELGTPVRRNLGQSRAGGPDCIELQGFALEIKRCERPALPAWWRQAVKQAQDIGREPLVLWRGSYEPWQALIATADGGYRKGTWEQAVLHIREKWARLFAVYPNEGTAA